MFGVAAAIEKQVVLIIKTMVGAMVAAGALAALYYMYGEQALILAVINTVGVLHLVIEYSERRGDSAEPAA